LPVAASVIPISDSNANQTGKEEQKIESSKSSMHKTNRVFKPKNTLTQEKVVPEPHRIHENLETANWN
jgi:hypothetical protein